MQRSTELEWQFAAPALGAARAWLESQPADPTGRHFSLRPPVELRDTYYDSSDWMIYRAGFALRMRRSRTDSGDAAGTESTEITLKSLHSARAGSPARRVELTQRVPVADMAATLSAGDGIGERIRELIGARPLRELFQANTRRERQCLLEAGNNLPLAEVDLDETSIEAAGGAVRKLQRVEVECLHSEPAAIDSVVQELCSAASLVPVEASKFQTGLELAGLLPGAPLELGTQSLNASQPFSAVLVVILRRYFATMLEHEPKVRAGAAAAVHDTRVAARHLEALLRATRDISPDWARQAHGAVRGLGKKLGAVRDCDVQLEFLDATLRSAPEQRDALLPLRERVAGDRNRARAELLREFDSPRNRAFQERWLTELRAPAATTAAGAAIAGVVAMDLIRRQARRVFKRAEALDQKSTPDDYHRVRVAGKRLRYLLDAFESLYGPAAREYCKTLSKMQDVLGEFHDASVREQRFSELVTRTAFPAATAFAIGRIVERDAGAFDDCRRKFDKAYRRVRRRRWRELLASMRRQAAAVS